VRFATFALLLSALLFAFSAPAFANEILYSVSPQDDLLRTVDPADASTGGSVSITLGGNPIAGAHGLATHPLTNQLWALVRTGSQLDPRLLVTVDRITGVAILVGNTGDLFVALAFDASGTLYGMTGDGASQPNALATLSTLDATPTFVLTPANGFGGHALAYHDLDGMLYHVADIDIFKLFEKISIGAYTSTPIPLSGTGFTHARALTYEGAGDFLLAMRAVGGPTKPGSGAGAEEFLTRLTDGGAVSLIGALDHVTRGLAFVTLPVPVEETSWGRIKSRGR